MYGGSGKLGRGGGAGSKRNIHAPPINRSSTAAPNGRISMGGVSDAGPRGRDVGGAAASGPAASSPATEESFSLVTRNPLNFAMALRLVPDLVEEINRVEAMGGTARIKFDSNASNPNGNVINVGDKNFKFTWSKEMGDLCDIYEERQSGEDGNGLMVESGGAWRKLNVQRVLDESTKNHVKMRSEEAERKLKSRKTVVLDHQNSSMKSQMKAPAAAKANTWRTPSNQKKEPPLKKLKPEPPPAGGPPKSVYKSGFSTTNNASKGTSVSPLSSQPEQLTKGHASSSVPPDAFTQTMNKTANSYQETPVRFQDKPNHSRNKEAKPPDLRSLMISLLMEHRSTGITLKFLERAIGDAMPTSVRQIEPILKQIATYQAPGRYHLKQGIDIESFKKPPSNSGSSPEINRYQSPAPPDKFAQLPDQDRSFSLRALEEQAQLNSNTPGHASGPVEEEIDILNISPDHSTGKKDNNSEGLVGTSSDSDSESNSSDNSGSVSHKSSSSDSESDAVSSKQAPDEDVDIMTSDDDDKGSKHKTVDYDDMANFEKQVEIKKDDDREDERAAANNYSDDYYEGEWYGDTRLPRGELKRISDGNETPYNSNKKLKGENSSNLFSGTIHSIFGESPHDSSPDRPILEAHKGPDDVTRDPTPQMLFNQGVQPRPISEPQLPGQRDFDTEKRIGSKQGKLGRGSEDSKRSLKDTGRNSKSYSPKDNKASKVDRTQVMNGRGRVLRREPSDLELGEFREPLPDEKITVPKTQSSVRQVEKRPTDSEYWNSDSGRGKTPNKPTADSRKSSNADAAFSGGVPDGPSKAKPQENYANDPTRPHRRETRPLPQHNRIPEVSGKSANVDAGTVQGTKLEANGYNKKAHADALEKQSGSKRVGKESKKQEPELLVDSTDRRKDASSVGSHESGQKRRESSSDEKSCPYMKYEKEEPELKGPIKDLLQYKEYVKEYQEKYESYCSLNKILVSYRDKFSKFGKDLEACVGKDSKRYQDLLVQMRSSFHQCGEKHKQRNKIFAVLHEELKHMKQMMKDFAASYTKD